MSWDEDPFDPPFRVRAVRPIVCYREGWRLIRDDYWFYVGLTFVGRLIGDLAPFWLLTGPMMCGLCICLLRRAHGRRVAFDQLFQGFNYFGDSLVATLCMGVPLTILIAIDYVLFLIGFVALLPNVPRGGPVDAATLWPIAGLSLLFYASLFVLIVVVNVPFAFTYELIVDRRLSGWQAVKLSTRAAFANLGGVFMLSLLSVVLLYAGMALCCVGVFLAMPISFAAGVVAYEQVFPRRDDPWDALPDEPHEDEPRGDEPETAIKLQ